MDTIRKCARTAEATAPGVQLPCSRAPAFTSSCGKEAWHLGPSLCREKCLLYAGNLPLRRRVSLSTVTDTLHRENHCFFIGDSLVILSCLVHLPWHSPRPSLPSGNCSTRLQHEETKWRTLSTRTKPRKKKELQPTSTFFLCSNLDRCIISAGTVCITHDTLLPIVRICKYIPEYIKQSCCSSLCRLASRNTSRSDGLFTALLKEKTESTKYKMDREGKTTTERLEGRERGRERNEGERRGGEREEGRREGKRREGEKR